MTPGRAAIVEGWPLFLTSLVIGIPFGVIARQAGLSIGEASAMSVLVFGGASQFAMVELLRGGAEGSFVALTVLLINARHLLMATALRPFVATASLSRRLGLAYVLTDEAFAMGIGHFRRGHRDLRYYTVFGTLLWCCWNAGTLLGATFGADIQDPRHFGVDFAITASFVAIVALGIRHRADATVAVAAALVAGALRLAGASSVAVVVAGALAPLVAFVPLVAFALREDRR